MKYRKKAVEIEAVHFTGDDIFHDLKELDNLGSLSEAEVERNWWINNSPDPKDAEGEFFIVKKTITVTYEEI